MATEIAVLRAVFRLSRRRVRAKIMITTSGSGQMLPLPMNEFLQEGLRPWLLEAACKAAGIGLTLRMQDGYDHSYNFISTFMDDHLKWHAERLG